MTYCSDHSPEVLPRHLDLMHHPLGSCFRLLISIMDLHKLLDNASSPTAYIRPDQQHPRQSPWSSTVEANMLPSFSTLAKSVDHATNDDSQCILNRYFAILIHSQYIFRRSIRSSSIMSPWRPPRAHLWPSSIKSFTCQLQPENEISNRPPGRQLDILLSAPFYPQCLPRLFWSTWSGILRLVVSAQHEFLLFTHLFSFSSCY